MECCEESPEALRVWLDREYAAAAEGHEKARECGRLADVMPAGAAWEASEQERVRMYGMAWHFETPAAMREAHAKRVEEAHQWKLAP
jgi:hypothetical protein